jgi:hypothetical protein
MEQLGSAGNDALQGIGQYGRDIFDPENSQSGRNIFEAQKAGQTPSMRDLLIRASQQILQGELQRKAGPGYDLARNAFARPSAGQERSPRRAF